MKKKLFKKKWPKVDPNDRAQVPDISAYVNFLGDHLLVAGHLGEGLLQLFGDPLQLLLLAHQLVLQPVNLDTNWSNLIWQQKFRLVCLNKNQLHWSIWTQINEITSVERNLHLFGQALGEISLFHSCLQPSPNSQQSCKIYIASIVSILWQNTAHSA